LAVVVAVVRVTMLTVAAAVQAQCFLALPLWVPQDMAWLSVAAAVLLQTGAIVLCLALQQLAVAAVATVATTETLARVAAVLEAISQTPVFQTAAVLALWAFAAVTGALVRAVQAAQVAAAWPHKAEILAAVSEAAALAETE
jgi:hypothetical protein